MPPIEEEVEEQEHPSGDASQDNAGGDSPEPMPDEGEETTVGDDDEGAEKKPSDEGEKAKADDKRKKSTRQFINELKVSRREAAERAERAERENAELKEKLSKVSAADDDPRPKRSDFEDPDAYEASRDEWLIRQARKGNEPAARDDKPPLPSAQDMERVDSARYVNQVGEERHEDYKEVVSKSEAKYSVEVFDAIIAVDDPEISADLVYYISNNPAKAAELSRLKGNALAIQVGRLASGIEAGTIDIKARSKAPSSAPKPIKPLGGGDARPRSSAQATSMDEYIAKRRAERKKAGLE